MSTSRHTYDMGIVGNCSYVAHVDMDGRVVWMCLPRFDSSCVFGSLLDPERGGELAVDAIEPPRTRRQEYLWNTNVLATTIEVEGGGFRITDCAPRFVHCGQIVRPLMLVRRLEPIGNAPRIRIRCRPRGDYGTVKPQVHVEDNHLRYDLGGDVVRLSTNIPLAYVETERELVLSERKYLILTWGPPFEGSVADAAEEHIRRTVHHWREWVRNCAIGRFYQQQVIRSALVLKLHEFEDTGAIIASSTTSLPEHPASGRNWDYRYCWLRDAHFTLTAFNRMGQFDAMQRFAQFIENVAASVEEPHLGLRPNSNDCRAFGAHRHFPPVVRVDGALSLPESTVALRGYDGTGMVRIGNAAYAQTQNDIYGQMIYALLKLYVDERLPREARASAERLIWPLLRISERSLGQPDASLWEFRDFRRRHCYTTLCHWVGAKSAMKIARELGDHEMRRAALRLTVRAERHLEECYDARLGAYVQEPGSQELDASTLQLIVLNYLDPSSERAARHLRALEEKLMVGGALMHRYTHADDFGVPVSALLICSFWYVEALAAMGRVEAALKQLETLLGYANHLGLLSEDVDPTDGSQWGNFPQTYSHVGLINAVMRITSKLDYPEFY